MRGKMICLYNIMDVEFEDIIIIKNIFIHHFRFYALCKFDFLVQNSLRHTFLLGGEKFQTPIKEKRFFFIFVKLNVTYLYVESKLNKKNLNLGNNWFF